MGVKHAGYETITLHVNVYHTLKIFNYEAEPNHIV